jgi:RNA polymerase sigma factor (sigma-70 family)
MNDFEEMYRRHYPDVHRFALFLTGNVDRAEDLVAETFVRAWTARGRLRYSSVRPYLFTITRNLYPDQLRQTRTPVEIPLNTPDVARPPDEQAHHAHARSGPPASERCLQARSWLFAWVFGTVAVISLVLWFRTKPDRGDRSTRRLAALALIWALALTALAAVSHGI